MAKQKKEKIKLVSRGEPVVAMGSNPPPPSCNTYLRRNPNSGCPDSRYKDVWAGLRYWK